MTRATPTAGGRRARFGLLTLVMLLAATASVAVATFIGERTSTRFDVTDTGEHRLSPRTESLLARLDRPYEIIVAMDPRSVERQARDRVLDVLDGMRRRARSLNVTRIDTGSESGLAEYRALVARLAERDRGGLLAQEQALDAAVRALDDQAAYFTGRLAPALRRIAELVPPADEQSREVARWFRQTESGAEQDAARMLEVAARARDSMTQGAPDAAGLPPLDRVASPLAATLRGMSEAMHKLGGDLADFSRTEWVEPEPRDIARPLASELFARRDAAALAADTLARLKPLDLQRVARALESANAVIVIGPPGAGLTAIEFGALFPPPETLEYAAGARTDLRRRAEELFATAIASLEDPLKPIAVIVHAETRRILTDPAVFAHFRPMAERLGLQGIDLAEWPVALDAEPPSLAPYDPAGNRPVVYLAHATDTTVTPAAATEQSGPARAEKLGAAISRLVREGRPMLLSLSPSTLPGYGQPDPTIAPLAGFGLTADTARPLLREFHLPQGRRVEGDHEVRIAESDHPIPRALRGLRTALPWPVAISRTEPPEGVRVTITDLFEVRDPGAWAESSWLALWQVPEAQRRGILNPPSNDSSRDSADGPWSVAVAASRTVPDRPGVQRLVVVGGNWWYRASWTGAQEVAVDGRLVPRYPGNAELLEAALLWLAGKDEWIAQTTAARAVAVIQPLQDSQLSLLRWSVVAGLPLLTLACGLAWRILRG